jgi:hypothetical protein
MQCACATVRRDLKNVEREIAALEEAARDGNVSVLAELRFLEELRERIEPRLLAVAA